MSTTITARYADLPVSRDIRIQSGRSWEERWTVSLDQEDAGAVAISFDDATTYQARFRAADDTVTVFDLTEHAAAGKVTMRLDGDDTAQLDRGRYTWEMMFIFPAGSTDFPDGATLSLFKGIAVVEEPVPAS